MNDDAHLKNRKALYSFLAAVTATILLGQILIPAVARIYVVVLPIQVSLLLGFFTLFFGALFVAYQLVGMYLKESPDES